MDSAQWKNGLAKFEGYLTAWYYPAAPMAPQDLSYRPIDAQNGNKRSGWHGLYEAEESDVAAEMASTARYGQRHRCAAPSLGRVSHDRVVMKNVESARNKDGAVELVSEKNNIELRQADRLRAGARRTDAGEVIPNFLPCFLLLFLLWPASGSLAMFPRVQDFYRDISAALGCEVCFKERCREVSFNRISESQPFSKV